MPAKKDRNEVRNRLQEIRSERAKLEARWIVLQNEETAILKFLSRKRGLPVTVEVE